VLGNGRDMSLELLRGHLALGGATLGAARDRLIHPTAGLAAVGAIHWLAFEKANSDLLLERAQRVVDVAVGLAVGHPVSGDGAWLALLGGSTALMVHANP
jgi:hypothetical protein